MHLAALGVSFLFTFFSTGSKNAPVDIRLQMQQKNFLRLERHRASEEVGGNESRSGNA